MSKKNKPSGHSTSKFHLRFIRLPNQILDTYDDLVYCSRKIIVAKSEITSEHPIVFDDEVVLAPGFEIVYFELMGKWFTVCKIRNLQGRHTGYYCDIITPPKLVAGGAVEITDLFLDLWVSPDLRFRVLDEDELEDAFSKGLITEEFYERAQKELKKLIHVVEQGRFPPRSIKRLEEKLYL